MPLRFSWGFQEQRKETPKQLLQMNIALLDIPIGMRQTGWLFRSVDENQGGLPPPRHQQMVRT